MKPCFIVGFSLFLIVILSGGRQAAVEESNPFAFTAHPHPASRWSIILANGFPPFTQQKETDRQISA
ncbi:MAG: hypothetical protein IH847_11565 [Acidobacteria bacterium]|nr:hypothetical protein [Acidobacteriota bacterium]